MASFRSSRAAENCLLDKGIEMRTESTLDLNGAVFRDSRGMKWLVHVTEGERCDCYCLLHLSHAALWASLGFMLPKQRENSGEEGNTVLRWHNPD